MKSAPRLRPLRLPNAAYQLGRFAIIALTIATLFAAGSPLALGQDEPSEESMSAYADAANFQTGGAIDLAIEAWNDFLKEYPKHEMAAEAAHYLGVCHMQNETPDYDAAAKAFTRATKNHEYDLREESLANMGWCLYASAGDGENAESRDVGKLKRSIETFRSLAKEFPKSRFLDRAYFYSGEAAYGMGDAKRAIESYDQLLSLTSAKESPLRCDALYARGVAHEELDQFDQAFNSYRQLLSSCKDDSLVTDVHTRIGDIMIMRKEFAEAVDSFKKAIKSSEVDEDIAYAMFRQAYALVQGEKPGEAAEVYRKLVEDFPDSPYAATATLAAAQSSYREGDFAKATKGFRDVLKQNNPAAATEAAHWLARIFIGQGEPAEAIAVAQKRLKGKVDGEFATDLRLDLAEALSMQPKTVAESLKVFEEIYRDDPKDPRAPRALYNAAFSALQINDPKKALSLSLEFVRQFPKDTLLADVRFVAAESQLLTGDPAKAADTYKTLLGSTKADNIQRPLWLIRTGTACNAARQFDDTIRILSGELDSFQRAEQKSEATLLIGRAHLLSKRFDEAAEAFLSCAKIAPKWPGSDEATLLAGQAYFSKGDKQRANDVWQSLVRSSPNSRMADQARYKIAQMLASAGQWKEAAALYDQIVKSKRDPGLVPYAFYGKGWTLMKSEQYQPALQTLDALLKEQKQHPLRNDATLARGITLRNLGQYDRAKTDLETYLSIPPKGTNLGHTLYELALIDQKEKSPGKAAKKLEQLVRDVPDYPSMDKVLYELGWSQQESGDKRGAVKNFTTLISKYPDASFVPEAAYFVGQSFYAKDDWKSAAKYFSIASKGTEAELSEKSHYRLGWSHFKASDYQAAESAFANQSKRHVNGKLVFDALMMVGECRFRRGDYQPALEGFKVARTQIQKNNDNSNSIRDPAERQVRELALLHGGQSAGQLKSWDEAIGWYNELRERFPSTTYLPQTFYEIGYSYQQKNEQDRTLHFFGEVADNYRNEIAARSRFMIGEIYFGKREFDKAIPEFQRVMFGYGAERAPDAIKNWQAKSGFEAGRCSELLLQVAKTDSARQKAKEYANEFFGYVIEKHPDHELNAKARERIEALQK